MADPDLAKLADWIYETDPDRNEIYYKLAEHDRRVKAETLAPDALTPERLAELRKVAEEGRDTAPGSWSVSWFSIDTASGEGGDFSVDHPGGTVCYGEDAGNHIAAFDPPTVLALLRKIDRLGALVDEFRKREESRDRVLTRRRAECDEARAESERLRAGGKALGETLHAVNAQIVDVTNSHDLIDDDGDGDWAGVYERLDDLKAERDRLRGEVAMRHDCPAEKYFSERNEARRERDRLAATVARVRALADEPEHRQHAGTITPAQLRAVLDGGRQT